MYPRFWYRTFLVHLFLSWPSHLCHRVSKRLQPHLVLERPSSRSFGTELLLQKLYHFKLSLLTHVVHFLGSFGVQSSRFVQAIRILSRVSRRVTGLNRLVLNLLRLEGNTSLGWWASLLDGWHRQILTQSQQVLIVLLNVRKPSILLNLICESLWLLLCLEKLLYLSLRGHLLLLNSSGGSLLLKQVCPAQLSEQLLRTGILLGLLGSSRVQGLWLEHLSQRILGHDLWLGLRLLLSLAIGVYDGREENGLVNLSLLKLLLDLVILFDLIVEHHSDFIDLFLEILVIFL